MYMYNICKCPYTKKCLCIKIQSYRITLLNLTCNAKIRKKSYVCDQVFMNSQQLKHNFSASYSVSKYLPPTVSGVLFYMLPIYVLAHSASIKSITNPQCTLISQIYLNKSISYYFEYLIISQLEKHSSAFLLINYYQPNKEIFKSQIPSHTYN